MIALIGSYMIWLVWIWIVSFATSVDAPSSTLSLDQACFLLAGTCIFAIVTSRRMPGGLASAYFVVLMALIAFNAAQAFMIPFVDTSAVGQPAEYRFLLTRQFSDDQIVATLSVVGAFLAAMHAAGLTCAQMLSRQVLPNPPMRSKLVAEHVLLQGATFVFAASAPLGLMQLWSSLQVVMSRGYFALYDPETLQYQSVFGILITFALPSAFYVFAMGRGWVRNLALGYISVYGIGMLAMGFRAWGMFALIALAWAYHRAVRKISGRMVGVAAVLTIGVLPIIGATRTTAFSDLTANQVMDAYQEMGSPVFALFAETGGSASTVTWTIELVPQERPFGLGGSFLNSLSAIFPNIAGGTHLSAESSLSSWLAWRVSPENAAVGGGIGYSALAEFYYNFGAIIGTLCAFAFGWILSWANCHLEDRSASLLWVAIGGVLLTFLPMYARADSSILFRPLGWFILAPMMVLLLVPGKKRASAMPNGYLLRDGRR